MSSTQKDDLIKALKECLASEIRTRDGIRDYLNGCECVQEQIDKKLPNDIQSNDTRLLSRILVQGAKLQLVASDRRIEGLEMKLLKAGISYDELAYFMNAITFPKERLESTLEILKTHANMSENFGVKKYTFDLIAAAQEDRSGLLTRVKKWESAEAERMRKVVKSVILLSHYMEKGWSIINALKRIRPKKKAG